MNKIYIVGTIDENSFKEFSEQLTEFETKAKASKHFADRPVEIEMNSFGGCAMDALAFYSRIRNSQLQINITAYGLIASAAVLVFAACDHRRMTKESWMMVHEDSDSVKAKNTSDFEKTASHMRSMENQWNDLLEKRTKAYSTEWASLHKKETYLTPEQCKELGIVDEII